MQIEECYKCGRITVRSNMLGCCSCEERYCQFCEKEEIQLCSNCSRDTCRKCISNKICDDCTII